MKTPHEYWVQWYSIEANRQHHRLMAKRWKQAVRTLLINRKGGKCEVCGTTEKLEIHEINGNPDKHSSKRFTEMRDGKRAYQVLCETHHADTDNWRRKR